MAGQNGMPRHAQLILPQLTAIIYSPVGYMGKWHSVTLLPILDLIPKLNTTNHLISIHL